MKQWTYRSTYSELRHGTEVNGQLHAPATLTRHISGMGRAADHSLPSNVEVKNVWSYTFTPQYVFMAWYLVKHRNNFTFRRRDWVRSRVDLDLVPLLRIKPRSSNP
jgi:hypothetical protein